MMTKTYLSLFITATIFLFSACNSDEKVTLDTAQIHSTAVLQSSALDEYTASEEKAIQLLEIANDRSNPSAAAKASIMRKAMKNIDEIGAGIIDRIEDLKKEMFTEIGENVKDLGPNSILNRSYSHIEPHRIAIYSLYKVKATGTTNVLDKSNKEIQALIEDIRLYRAAICSELVQSNSTTDQKPFFFKDPKIDQAKDFDELMQKLHKAIIKSHIAPDDQEAVRKLYVDLTFTDDHWSEVFQKDMPWLTAFGVLLSIEDNILTARKNALQLMASRFSLGSEFPISALEPVVFGPEVAYEGEEVLMEVTLAGYNRDNQPMVQVQGAQLVEIRDGKGIVKSMAPNGATEMTIAGTVAIRSRSGIIRSYPWRKRIVILKRDEDYYSIHGPKKH